MYITQNFLLGYSKDLSKGRKTVFVCYDSTLGSAEILVYAN